MTDGLIDSDLSHITFPLAGRTHAWAASTQSDML